MLFNSLDEMNKASQEVREVDRVQWADQSNKSEASPQKISIQKS